MITLIHLLVAAVAIGAGASAGFEAVHDPLSSLSSVSVAVIGFGPAGLFFCHHLEERRRKLLLEYEHNLQTNQTNTAVEHHLARLPRVVSFEKEAGPGGVWRADRVAKESLWTNGHKELMEFFDYTFVDHYGPKTKIPSYLPRAAILEFMLARVTRHAPDFLQRYAQFQTEVTKVFYTEGTKKFTVQTKHVQTGVESTHYFDKCIWAAGVYGIPQKPRSLLTALQNFTRGPVVHSSEHVDWDAHVTRKHILLIGGSYSAQDIALTAIKRGVDRVTIVVRRADHETPVLWADSWPHNKVQILMNLAPKGVDRETQTIRFGTVPSSDLELKIHEKDNYQDLPGNIDLENVDTIFLCTGYEPSYKMMDAAQFSRKPDGDARYKEENKIRIPKDWTMSPDNPLNSLLNVTNPRKIKVSKLIDLHFYHGCVYVLNPNYMVIDSSNHETHLLTIDITAHLALSVILGETPIPSREQLVHDHRQWVMQGMNFPYIRFWLDPNYQTAMRQLFVSRFNQGMGLPGAAENIMHYYDYYYREWAQAAKDGHYPVDYGSSRDGLSEMGRAVIKTDMYGGSSTRGDANETFRDLWWNDDDENDGKPKSGFRLKSLFTGILAAPFHSPWMELDDMAHPVDLAKQEEDEEEEDDDEEEEEDYYITTTDSTYSLSPSEVDGTAAHPHQPTGLGVVLERGPSNCAHENYIETPETMILS